MKLYNLRYSPGDNNGGNGHGDDEDVIDDRDDGFADSFQTDLNGENKNKPKPKDNNDDDDDDGHDDDSDNDDNDDQDEDIDLNKLDHDALVSLAKENKIEITKEDASDDEIRDIIHESGNNNADEQVDAEDTITQLMATVNNLAALVDTNDVVNAGDLSEEDIELVTADEFTEFKDADSAEALNKLLNKTLKKAITISDARSNTISDVKLTNKLTAAKISEHYYIQNKDLAPVADYVMQMAKGLMTKKENEGLSLAELLNKAGVATRTNLGIPTKSKSKESLDDEKAKKKRSFKVPGGNGNRSHVRRKVSVKAKGLVAEVDEFVKSQTGKRNL